MSTGELLAKGQQQINQGQYEEAIRTFSSILQTDPRTVDAYRGRSEAKLLLGQYADAYDDIFALANATIQPSDVDDLGNQIKASYAQRLQSSPWDVPALTGAAFAEWAYWGYLDAIPHLNKLLQLNPNNVYAKLFRGSNRLFAGVDLAAGEADLDAAIALAPSSAHVRYVVSDAYTYALPDLVRAYDEASLALSWGLDTPRVRAILATALNDHYGNLPAAAAHIKAHIDQVTDVTQTMSTLPVGGQMTLNLVPWKTFHIPLTLTKGQKLNITTSSTIWNVWDSILVVIDPNGNPVVGSDDYIDYFAGLNNWTVPKSGTYRLEVTSFEAMHTGPLIVSRQ
jgi:hypothetical protein